MAIKYRPQHCVVTKLISILAITRVKMAKDGVFPEVT